MARNADGLGTRPHKWRGRWRAALTVGYDPTGKPDRRWVYGATQAECHGKLDDLRKQQASGLLAARQRTYTLATYLDERLEQKALEVKPRTIPIYRSELAHVTKVLGGMKLSAIKPADVQRMMRAINGSQVRYTYFRGEGKVKTRTVTLTARAANEAKSILSNAPDDAIDPRPHRNQHSQARAQPEARGSPSSPCGRPRRSCASPTPRWLAPATTMPSST